MTTEAIINAGGKSGRPSAYAIGLSVAAAIYAVLFLYFVAASVVSAPVYDFLSWVQFYFDSEKTGDWWSYLWTPHNEHRIIWTRALVAIDVRLFGGNTLPFMAFALVLTSTMVLALLWQVFGSPLPPKVKAVVVPLLVFLLLPATLAIANSMPGIGVNLHAATFVVFAISLLDVGIERRSNLKILLSLMVAILAGFGGSGGLLVWPVLTYSAWRFGPKNWALTFFAVGTTYSVLNFAGVPSSFGGVTLGRALPSIDYVIRFLGLPWSHSSALAWPSRAIGLGILCGGAWLLIRDFFLDRSTSRLERIGLNLILYAFLVAAAAAVARWNVATERGIPIRYAIFTVLAHAGILLASMPFLQRLLEGASQKRAKLLITAVTLLLLLQQIIIGTAAVQEASRYNSAWAEFVSGAWTSEMEHYVYPDEATARADLKTLQLHHVYGQ
jgi:hypothetical protein